MNVFGHYVVFWLYLPSPSAHKCVHAHMNTQMQGLGRLHLSSCVSLWAEGQQSHWNICQALTAVMDKQYFLPVAAPEKKKKKEIFWLWLVPLYILGQCPSPCMLYPNLSYKEAPPEMTDNIIFLRTCRVLFPIQVCGCVYVFGTAASWLIY